MLWNGLGARNRKHFDVVPRERVLVGKEVWGLGF